MHVRFFCGGARTIALFQHTASSRPLSFSCHARCATQVVRVLIERDRTLKQIADASGMPRYDITLVLCMLRRKKCVCLDFGYLSPPTRRSRDGFVVANDSPLITFETKAMHALSFTIVLHAFADALTASLSGLPAVQARETLTWLLQHDIVTFIGEAPPP